MVLIPLSWHISVPSGEGGNHPISFDCSMSMLTPPQRPRAFLFRCRQQGRLPSALTYKLTVAYDPDPDGISLDEEIQSLLSEMFNIAESYNCSMEADIYEVGGQQRSW